MSEIEDLVRQSEGERWWLSLHSLSMDGPAGRDEGGLKIDDRVKECHGDSSNCPQLSVSKMSISLEGHQQSAATALSLAEWQVLLQDNWIEVKVSFFSPWGDKKTGQKAVFGCPQPVQEPLVKSINHSQKANYNNFFSKDLCSFS